MQFTLLINERSTDYQLFLVSVAELSTVRKGDTTMSDSRSIFEKLTASKTALTTFITAGVAGIGSTIVNGYNAVTTNILSKNIHEAAAAGRLIEDAQKFETAAYRSSQVSGYSVLATVALPTAVLTIPALAKWQSIDAVVDKFKNIRDNVKFSIGVPCQLAGMGLIIKAANEDGAHNPQLAIAWGVSGMMLLNIGNMLVLSNPTRVNQSGMYSERLVNPSAPGTMINSDPEPGYQQFGFDKS